MITIKSYTDLEQSKKLAEFLPWVSADMFYADLLVDNKHQYIVHPLETYGFETFEDTKLKVSKRLSFIPCWSLASLLDIIPQEIFDGEYIINITEGRDNKWILTYDYCENSNISYYGLSSDADNLVDTCYEMILKLNERKIL